MTPPGRGGGSTTAEALKKRWFGRARATGSRAPTHGGYQPPQGPR
eukprot:CAMPEP_0118821088 /NCGR_PEP_ID=MMETSP1162-20130426/8204_1 /TAXON_ID=33656 /ORGANISM="Phaeocystis Sp, Strain CCMP2710" /LENGTH=44 /DNA_ID= /DNA_START= /DNA_END= /DNA_ORIENTATION=